MKNLKLYYSESCPFCVKVMKYVEANDLDLELVDVTNDKELQNEVMSLGGKYQVPMMTIDGKPMYESDDIIGWLKENK